MFLKYIPTHKNESSISLVGATNFTRSLFLFATSNITWGQYILSKSFTTDSHIKNPYNILERQVKYLCVQKGNSHILGNKSHKTTKSR